MTNPPNAGVLATQASGPARKPGEEPIAIAERQFAEAKVAAEGVKQAAIGQAMTIKDVAAHVAAIRAAERAYNLALAQAAAATGLIDAAPYLQAAAAT
jgi:hypothetical protein